MVVYVVSVGLEGWGGIGWLGTCWTDGGLVEGLFFGDLKDCAGTVVPVIQGPWYLA